MEPAFYYDETRISRKELSFSKYKIESNPANPSPAS